jgi:hypothetical protein
MSGYNTEKLNMDNNIIGECHTTYTSTVVCNDKECYYNESGIAKCFNQGEQFCQGKLMLEQKLIIQIFV